MLSSRASSAAPFTGAREAALLKWLNTFPLDTPIEALSELCDGLVFCKILEDFNPEYAVSEKERMAGGSSLWLRKKTCVEAVYKSLRRFLRDHVDVNLDYLTVKNNIDVDSIAEHDDVEQTMKLLAIFLMAALHNPKKEAYIMTIQEKLDDESQLQIMNLVAEMHKLQGAHTKDTNTNLAPNPERDFDLAFEEEHSKLQAEHDALRKKHADYITRFEDLHAKNEELHARNELVERKLHELEQASTNDKNDVINTGLRITIEELETIIARHENDIEVNRVNREQMTKELSSLRRSADRVTELDDEVRVLRNDNAILVKKANTVDHFQRKLELQSSMEKENAKLREQVDVLENNQKDYDQVHTDNEKYQKTLKENRQMLEGYEIELLEIQRQNKSLKDVLRNCESKITELNSKSLRDEDFIKDLQEQLKIGGDAPLSPTTPTVRPGPLSLEQELEQSEDPTHMLRLENARLKAENQLLKSGNAGTTNAELRTALEESDRVQKRYEENIQELTVKNALLEEDFKGISSSSPTVKDGAIASSRKAYLETNQELVATRSKLVEVQAALANRNREILQAKADLQAVTAEEIDALELLKRTNQSITSSLQNDLELLQGKQKSLEIDLQQHQNHLIQSLLAKDKLEKELGAIKEGNPATSQEGLGAMKEQTEQHDRVVQDLQRRLRMAEEGGVDAQKAANETLIKNLTRENSLMATAWYDLTSRLQSNHVVLQRRQDAPKSWLNKQRQMVNASRR